MPATETDYRRNQNHCIVSVGIPARGELSRQVGPDREQRPSAMDFNEAALSFGAQSLRFRNGKACTSDQAFADGCDWQHAITVDQALVPTPGQTIRLIVINSNHLTGSGAWDHVFFFRCRNGRAVSEFSESYRYGVKIEKRSNTELRLVSGEWLKGDPDCCPSRQKTEIFRWDSKKMPLP